MNNNDYEVYRHTTLGNTLQETLDEFIQSNQLSKNLSLHVLKEFDKAFGKSFSKNVRAKANFKGKLDTYRLCDNVWTLLLKEVKVTINDNLHNTPTPEEVSINRLKIVACDGKSEGKQNKNAVLDDQ